MRNADFTHRFHQPTLRLQPIRRTVEDLGATENLARSSFESMDKYEKKKYQESNKNTQLR